MTESPIEYVLSCVLLALLFLVLCLFDPFRTDEND